MDRAGAISKAFELSNLTRHPLSGVVPIKVLSELKDVGEKFEINTDLRVAHFLAQCAHESGGFKRVLENLNYSAKGLEGTFGTRKHFPNGLAQQYHRKPEAIANHVYQNRMGNGNEASGDGWKFRGKGYIQLTGHDNHKAFGDSIGIDLVENPDLVASKYPLLSAAWFFYENNIIKMADEGATDLVVKKITKKVNGGYNGLEDRTEHFNEYIKILLA